MHSSPGAIPAPQTVPALPVPICFPLAGDIPVGGGHVSVLVLIHSLDRRRFRPIVAVHGDGPVRRWLEEQGVRDEIGVLQRCVRDRHRVRIGDVALICRRSWALAQFLRERKVEIVHVNDTIMLSTWALATRVAGAKLLWHKRGRWNDRLASSVLVAGRGSRDRHISIRSATSTFSEVLDHLQCRRKGAKAPESRGVPTALAGRNGLAVEHEYSRLLCGYRQGTQASRSIS